MKGFLIAVLSSAAVIAVPVFAAQVLPINDQLLPRALGVTFGAAYEDVFRQYEEQGYDPSSIVISFPSLPHEDQMPGQPVRRRGLYFQAAYDYTLVELRDARKAIYKVFQGKLMGVEVLFDPCSENVVFDPDCKSRYDNLSSVLEEKYGPPREPRKLLEQIRSGFPKFWRTDDLEICLCIKSSVSLEYTYLPLKTEKDERDRQLDKEVL